MVIMSPSEAALDVLVSVVYVSSAHTELTSAELTELLTDIRERNRRRNITGLLLYRGGNFLQVVEGPEREIDALLKALRKDRRHDGLIVIKRSRIHERQFSEWQMAFRDITGGDLMNMEGYSPFMELSFTAAEFHAKPNQCHRLLLQFKEKIR